MVTYSDGTAEEFNNGENVKIEECESCEMMTCGCSCATMAYLYNKRVNSRDTILEQELYCLLNTNIDLPYVEVLQLEKKLVHIDYLRTWIGIPK